MGYEMGLESFRLEMKEVELRRRIESDFSNFLFRTTSASESAEAL